MVHVTEIKEKNFDLSKMCKFHQSEKCICLSIANVLILVGCSGVSSWVRGTKFHVCMSASYMFPT